MSEQHRVYSPVLFERKQLEGKWIDSGPRFRLCRQNVSFRKGREDMMRPGVLPLRPHLFGVSTTLARRRHMSPHAEFDRQRVPGASMRTVGVILGGS